MFASKEMSLQLKEQIYTSDKTRFMTCEFLKLKKTGSE